MIRITTLFLCMLMGMSAFAQEKITISGSVKDGKNNILPYADILVLTADENEHILQFTVTDSKGKFNLEFSPSIQNMRVKVNKMGFKKKAQDLVVNPEKQIYYFSFVMDEKMEVLEEVEVKAKPKARINKDTTIFNLQNIVNGSERVVEDIIAKCPGMELKADGRFKFKGKDVTNMLLDGDDLFKGGYTIGSKNIKAEDIVGVEAIENYTKNPLLQGVEITDKVALNLKFKPGLSLANKVELGYGYKERYTANHTGIAITKKLKAFNLFNYNNLGKNVGQHHFNPLSHLMMLGAGGGTSGTKTNTFLGSSSVSSLFKAQQSDRNNAFFGSINILPRLNKTTTVTANLNFLSDRSLQENEFKTVYKFDPDNPLVVTQQDKKRYKPRYFNADVEFNKYIGKNSINNVLQFTRLRNTESTASINNGKNQELSSKSKEFYLYNSTKFVSRINEKNGLTLKATFAFNETPERLYIMPGINFDNNKLENGVANFQDIKSEKESAKLNGYFYHKINNYSKINLRFGVDYHDQTLRSDLIQNATQERYTNKVDYRTILPYLNASYRLEYKGLQVSPSVGVNLYDYSYKENGAVNDTDDQKLLLNTSLGLRYKINRYHEVSSGISRNQSKPSDKNLFTDFVMISNRSLQTNKLSFDAITSRRLNFSYDYRDMLNDFSFGLSFSYDDKDKAMQSALDISQDVTYTTYFLSNKGSKNYNYNGNLRKFVSALNSTVSWSSGYSTGEYYNSVNSAALRKNESKSWNHRFNFETNFIGDFIYGVGAAYGKSEYSSESSDPVKNENVNGNALVIYKPNDQFVTRVTYNYSIPNLSNRGNYTQKLDATLQFYSKSKNISFRLEGHNLLDQKDMDLINNTDYATTTSNVKLQERYFLFSVGFSF